MPDEALAFASASELRKLIDSKQVSVVELTEMFLGRIEPEPYPERVPYRHWGRSTVIRTGGRQGVDTRGDSWSSAWYPNINKRP